MNKKYPNPSLKKKHNGNLKSPDEIMQSEIVIAKREHAG